MNYFCPRISSRRWARRCAIDAHSEAAKGQLRTAPHFPALGTSMLSLCEWGEAFPCFPCIRTCRSSLWPHRSMLVLLFLGSPFLGVNPDLLGRISNFLGQNSKFVLLNSHLLGGEFPLSWGRMPDVLGANSQLVGILPSGFEQHCTVLYNQQRCSDPAVIGSPITARGAQEVGAAGMCGSTKPTSIRPSL